MKSYRMGKNFPFISVRPFVSLLPPLPPHHWLPYPHWTILSPLRVAPLLITLRLVLLALGSSGSSASIKSFSLLPPLDPSSTGRGKRRDGRDS